MSKPKEIQIPGKDYFAWQYEEQTIDRISSKRGSYKDKDIITVL